ncbi:MAG: hypothetical protein KC910_08785 [Candidatus Eremiobacteraeota bacterium]|nr:hypothetical protein [Candidatus Eremiobacteraeota bacterium]
MMKLARREHAFLLACWLFLSLGASAEDPATKQIGICKTNSGVMSVVVFDAKGTEGVALLLDDKIKKSHVQVLLKEAEFRKFVNGIRVAATTMKKVKENESRFVANYKGSGEISIAVMNKPPMGQAVLLELIQDDKNGLFLLTSKELADFEDLLTKATRTSSH